MVVSKKLVPFLIGLIILLAPGLAGCGDSTPLTHTNPPAVRPTAPFIQVAPISIGGARKMVLTTAPGLTLYYSTADTGAKSACAGQCAAVWHPLTFAGPGAPIAPQGLPGTLGLVAVASGSQLEYNGHPLYTYAKDTAPGQVGGQGLSGEWFVATPDLPRNG